MMESPDEAVEMAWPMVLQAVVADVHSLLSLPLTPFTYHVVADAIGARARSNAVPSSLLGWNLMTRLRGEECRLELNKESQPECNVTRYPAMNPMRASSGVLCVVEAALVCSTPGAANELGKSV